MIAHRLHCKVAQGLARSQTYRGHQICSAGDAPPGSTGLPGGRRSATAALFIVIKIYLVYSCFDDYCV